jgi:HK97 gp10 family phage protein
MGSSFSYKIEGLNELSGKLKSFSQGVKDGIEDELNKAAEDIVTLAKQKAPVNDGLLQNGISAEGTDLKRKVNVLPKYAPYIEFGTGSKVSIPAEWSQYAAQFKGKSGGTWDEFIKSLTAWVHKKGLAGTYSVKTRKRTGKKSLQENQDREVAYLIARSILAKGIKPHPFLYPAFKEGTKDLLDRIKFVIEDEGNKL